MFQGNFCRVSNGSSNIRGYYHEIENGRVTITDHRAIEMTKTIITVKNHCIATQRITVNGKTIYFCEYGKVEYQKGQYRLRFRKGTNRGLDGLSTRYDDKVLGYAGTTKTFYRNGRLIWQRFTHANKRLCYHFNALSRKPFQMYHDDGSLMVEYHGKIDSARKFEGRTMFAGEPWRWNEQGGMMIGQGFDATFVQYRKDGRIVSKGTIEKRQRVGEWVLNGKEIFYFNGLEISSRLYHTPPEKLSVKKVLAIPDADVRSIMIGRIGLERLAKEANPVIVHKQGSMRLLRFDIQTGKSQMFGFAPDRFFQLLQVKCPSTGADYFLRVPPEMKKCEQARQWTFGVERGQKHIKFDIEV